MTSRRVPSLPSMSCTVTRSCVAVAAQAAFQQVGDAELLRNHPEVFVLALEREARRTARSHAEPGLPPAGRATSSARPSAMTSCSGSPVRFVNGSTAMVCTGGAARGRNSATPPATTKASTARAATQPGASPEAADVHAWRIPPLKGSGHPRSRRRRRTGLPGPAPTLLPSPPAVHRQLMALPVSRPGPLPGLAGTRPGEQFVQHHAQRIDVAAHVDRLRRAAVPGWRIPASARGHRLRVIEGSSGLRLQQPRHAEIQQAHLALCR